MKTGQVFVSHTSDMARFPKSRPFVQAALDAVGRAGMASVDMRYFAAQDSGPADYCRARVRSCEIYVAVIGFRYGSIVPGHDISYTELEFEAATAAGLPRLVFLLDEPAVMAAGLADADRGPVERFRQRLRDAGLIAGHFSSADGLELKVFQALTEDASGGHSGGADMPSAPAFGELLRHLRAEAGLTQRALARAAGVSPQALSDLERGKTLRARTTTAQLLADALKLQGPARTRFEAAAQGRLPTATVMRTLPRDIAEFTGRVAERQTITESLRPSARNSPGATMIWAIDGMPGVGKSAFAVHVAHQAAARFPDGQIYLNLHGHAAGQSAVEPAEALATLLQEVGVVPLMIPDGLDARADMWRDRLAGRRVLLLLDDAVSRDQIEPLLPASSGCLVLITSRRTLAGLGDARQLTLGTLPPADAAELLVRLARPSGQRGDRDGVSGVVRECGYLPLAITLAAGRLRSHPSWSAAYLNEQLRSAPRRLEVMQAENQAVAASFDLSYRNLAAGHQLLFRRLALHPGTTFDAYQAAALGDMRLQLAEITLDMLYNDHLIEEPTPGRYRMHDLVRAFAAQAAEQDPQADRDATVRRLMDYYLTAANSADALLAPRHRDHAAGVAGSIPTTAPFTDRAQAVAWIRIEYDNLKRCILDATDKGWHSYAAALPAAMFAYLQERGPWSSAVPLLESAVAAARQTGRPNTVAVALTYLGVAHFLADSYEASSAALTEAMVIFDGLGDQIGYADAQARLGVTLRLSGDLPAAVEALTAALTVYRGAADTSGAAIALSQLGVARRLAGEYLASEDALTEALELHRAAGYQVGEAGALNELGVTRYLSGQYASGIKSLTEGLDLFDQLESLLGKATSLNYLGEALRLSGQHQQAIDTQNQALKVFEELGERLGYADALALLGGTQIRVGNYSAAAENLTSALQMFRELKNLLGQATVLNDLALLAHLTSHLPEAVRTALEALRQFQDLGTVPGQAESLNNLGTMLLAAGDTAQAARHHRHALRLSRTANMPLEEARALEGIGRALIPGNRLSGVDHLNRALAVYHSVGSSHATKLIADFGDPAT